MKKRKYKIFRKELPKFLCVKKSRARLEKRAFSLIELSIVLIIISILITGALSVSLTGIINAKTKVTNERIDAIYKALQSYLATHYYLPCPASLILTKSSATYGQEVITGSHDVSGSCSVSGGGTYYANQDNSVFYGMVPVNTLGLSSDLGEDGFGNKFIYIVNNNDIYANYPNTSAFGGGGFSNPSTSSAIYILEKPSGNSVADVSFVIMSLGANKYGAYNATSTTQNSTSTDSSEETNYLTSIAALAADFGVIASYNSVDYTNKVVITSSDATSEIFDDIVFFKRKIDFANDAGASFLMGCDATGLTGYSNAYTGQLVYRGSTCTPDTSVTPSKRCSNGSWINITTCSAGSS